jgi:hypothetical protein
MDLVDAYWGQPVDTQEFVEYYVPYEVCTYRTADGDYRQVTYKNRVVSRPTSNVADVRTSFLILNEVGVRINQSDSSPKTYMAFSSPAWIASIIW